MAKSPYNLTNEVLAMIIKPIIDNLFNESPVALITGAGQRIGAGIVETLHNAGFRVIIHYNTSRNDAQQRVERFNKVRADSAIAIKANLLQQQEILLLAKQSLDHWGGRIDALVNNASSYYPTPIEMATEQHWDDLFGSNLKAPFFLTQAFAATLKKQQGCIINIVDINAQQPLLNHSLYCAAKTGLAMMTQALAKELAPEIRVNGVSPGSILWPENTSLTATEKAVMIEKIPLKRQGLVSDIARTVLFLINEAPYITGQILTVDGGKSL